MGKILPRPVPPCGPPAARLVPVRALAAPVLALVALALVLLAGAGPALAQGGEGVRGTLNNAGERVAGAKITVEQDGEEVAEAETDANGQFSIPLPEPGDYVVKLDLDSLPEGVTVRDEGGEEREVTVRPGQRSRRRCSCWARAPARRPEPPTARCSCSSRGLQFGLVIAMAAIGLSLIFGTTGLTNFAHGEFLTGGAFAAYFFNVTLGMNLIPATLLAIVVGMVFGGLLDKGLWAPLRRRGTGLIAALVVSIGLALFLRYVFLYVFGGSSRSYAQYATQRPISLGPISIPPRDLVIMAISALVLGIVGYALITPGSARRPARSPTTRRWPPPRASTSSASSTWSGSSARRWRCSAACSSRCRSRSATCSGFQILLLLFAGVTLGGLGTAFGALVGCLVIGIFTQMSTLVIPAELQNVGALAVLILILVVRPQGILGRAERVG